MSTYTKKLLSANATGEPVLISQTATPGDLIHTAHLTRLDEIILNCSNIHTDSVEVTVEFGGVTAAHQIKITVPSKTGLFALIPQEMHRILTGAKEVRVFAGTTNVINVGGCANEIIP